MSKQSVFVNQSSRTYFSVSTAASNFASESYIR